MKLNAHSRIVEIWISSTIEEADVRKLCQYYIEEGLYPVIFRSGKKNLAERTAHLLSHNNK